MGMTSTTHKNVDEFIEGFIAALIAQGVISIDPNAQSTNLGVKRIYTLLRKLVEEASPQDQSWLLKTKNLIAPSNIGTYDYFLSALRSRQLGFVTSPNPRYSEISFRLSRPHARDLLSKISPSVRVAAEAAANAFLDQNSMNESQEGGRDVIKPDTGPTERFVWGHS